LFKGSVIADEISSGSSILSAYNPQASTALAKYTSVEEKLLNQSDYLQDPRNHGSSH
jgi:hypothetical protein